MNACDKKRIAQKARNIIADPSAWCQHSMALNKSGFTTGVQNPHAVRWDLKGSLMKAADGGEVKTIIEDLELVAIQVLGLEEPVNLGDINDMHGHAAVLRIVDAYIAQAA